MAALSADELLDHVIDMLRARRPSLVRMDVLHAAVFGSAARGDNRDHSDVDVMVEVDPTKVATIFDIGEIQRCVLLLALVRQYGVSWGSAAGPRIRRRLAAPGKPAVRIGKTAAILARPPPATRPAPSPAILG